MKPEGCKTPQAARAMAAGVREARVTVHGRLSVELDAELSALEIAFHRRADALAKKRPRRKR